MDAVPHNQGATSYKSQADQELYYWHTYNTLDYWLQESHGAELYSEVSDGLLCAFSD